MATKIIVFCNKNSTEFVGNLVEKAWEQYSDSDGRRSSKFIDSEKIDDSLQKERYCDIILVDNYLDYINLNLVELIKINPNSHQAADKIFFFITPELFWKTENIDEGYEYALDIITNKLNKENHILQLRFLSILPYEILINRCRSSLKRLVESFPYYDLLQDQAGICERSLIEYTATHYLLIKKLALSDAGYINYLLHEIGNTVTCPDPSEENDKNLLNSISGLNYLNKDIQVLFATYTFDSRVDVFQKIKKALNDLLLNYYSDPVNRSYNKFQYKVMIVEDDRVYRSFLKTELQNFFETVDAIDQDQNKEFSDTLKDNLSKVTEKYDIVFLDLMFKNGNGNWADYSGLDLYKNIKSRNHYCVTPIITSLPRAVVSTLIKEIDENGVPFHMLLSKANGKDYFILDLKDKLPDIIKTCRDNQKKRTIFQPIPKEGIFKIIPGMIFRFVKEKKEEFEGFVTASRNFFEMYKRGELSVSTPGWNQGNLPSPQMLRPEKLTESYIGMMLPFILTHRLIVIDYTLKMGDNYIITAEYEKNVLSKICKSSVFNTLYLTSKLGFNKLKGKREQQGYEILRQNLFPHEYAYILNYSKFDLKEYPQLKDWFCQVLCELDIYENWDELHLEYYPYLNIEDIDSSDEGIKESNINDIYISADNLINFLAALIKLEDYENVFLTKMYEKVSKLCQKCTGFTDIPKDILYLIREIGNI